MSGHKEAKKYFACYGHGRFIPKLAETKESIVPDAIDFRIVDGEWDSFETCEDFCRAMNISLKIGEGSGFEECY